MFFYLDDAVIGKETCFKGKGIIESLSIDLTAEDKGNISISVRGSGALELIVNGKAVDADEFAWVPSFGMEIREDGCLYVTANGDNNPFILDKDGYLKVKL